MTRAALYEQNSQSNSAKSALCDITEGTESFPDLISLPKCQILAPPEHMDAAPTQQQSKQSAKSHCLVLAAGWKQRAKEV